MKIREGGVGGELNEQEISVGTIAIVSGCCCQHVCAALSRPPADGWKSFRQSVSAGALMFQHAGHFNYNSVAANVVLVH